MDLLNQYPLAVPGDITQIEHCLLTLPRPGKRRSNSLLTSCGLEQCRDTLNQLKACPAFDTAGAAKQYGQAKLSLPPGARPNSTIFKLWIQTFKKCAIISLVFSFRLVNNKPTQLHDYQDDKTSRATIGDGAGSFYVVWKILPNMD